MQHVFLSGGAYGANWLWMLIPFVVFIILVKLGQLLSKRIFDILSHIQSKQQLMDNAAASTEDVHTNI